MGRFIEIRSYTLQPGTRSLFQKRFMTQSLPLLQKWNMDVVTFGLSPHDDISAYLIRAYASLEDRQQQQDAFYGSEDWLRGPREGIVSLIDTYTVVVLEVDEQTMQGLRNLPY